MSGVPRHILHLVDALGADAQITVISDQDEGGYAPLANTSAQHVVVEGLRNKLSLQHLWAGITGLMKAFDSHAPDLIWVHARLPILLLRLALALRLWRPGCPVAFTHHGLPYGPGYHPVVHWLCRQLERVLVASCPPQNLIFLNCRMAGWMARDTGGLRLARHRVHILPNCSDLHPYAPVQKPKTATRTLVMTGRAGRQKDYAFAARLLAALPNHYQLMLCGPGTEDQMVQRKITAGLPPWDVKRISFTGPIPDARLPLLGADAYLLTSRYEGTPIGALEAFEAGLPIILRNFPGATDLTALHPCSLLVGTQDLAKDARQIDALLDRFQANEDALRRDIQAVWQRNWSPRLFQRNARALLRALLAEVRHEQAAPDFVRDALALHPSHRKNATVPPPTPQPSGTGGGPSAGNG